MSERLKGTVFIHYTSNLGNYQSLRVEATREYWMDSSDTFGELKILDKEVIAWMKDRGVAPSIVRAVPKEEKKKA